MSVMVGVGKGARHGILVKNAEAIERAEKVTHLIVDKTGTLTAGKPEVIEVETASDTNVKDLLSIAAAVESHSEHPLARSIVERAHREGLELADVEDFNSTTGGGVEARLKGTLIRVGKQAFLEGAGVRFDTSLLRRAESLQEKARTVVWAAREDELLGFIAIADPIKSTSREALDTLHQLGIKVIMCTGDNERTAHAVARELGIDEVHAGVSPEDKQEIVNALRNKGHRVAMAGDGINDAPALAAADVGIAMGTGTEVAIESAGLTLVKGDLRGIVSAFLLSRAVMRNIRQNLFFAFIYNVLGVPLAAGVLYPVLGLLLNPMIAGAAMSFSSVSVLTNALRLRNARIHLQ